MRGVKALWRALGLVLPALLVTASAVLLAAAVGAMLLDADRAAQWQLFTEGAACWVVGVAWGGHATLSARSPLARPHVERP
jgi:putative copper export protein